MKKKPIKKKIKKISKKKIGKKKIGKKKTIKKIPKTNKEKPIGKITHYFGNIKVGIFKFKKPIKIGDEILIKGATTEFRQKINSMQYDYKEIKKAPINKEIGIKVSKRVREGDLIFK